MNFRVLIGLIVSLFFITACQKEAAPPQQVEDVFFVFPNPCKSFIEYGTKIADERWEVSLISPQNEELLSREVTKAPPGTYTFDLSEEAVGTYLFEIKRGDLSFQQELVKIE